MWLAWVVREGKRAATRCSVRQVPNWIRDGASVTSNSSSSARLLQVFQIRDSRRGEVCNKQSNLKVSEAIAQAMNRPACFCAWW